MTFTGIFHKHNFLKFRTFNCLWLNGAVKDSDPAMTCKEIASELRVPPNKVSRMMSNCRAKHAKYFIRLKPQKGSREYRYQLSKNGLEWYMKYMRRFLSGYELNFRKQSPEQIYDAGTLVSKEELKEALDMELDQNILRQYIGVTKAGHEDYERRKQKQKEAAIVDQYIV